MKKLNLKNISRVRLIEIIKENAVDGVYVNEGIELSLRDDGEGVDLKYGKIRAFLLKHSNSAADWYIHEAYNLIGASDVVLAIHHIATVFDADLTSGSSPKIREDTPVLDERDTEIANLKGQLEIYRRLMPSTAKVTYESL